MNYFPYCLTQIGKKLDTLIQLPRVFLKNKTNHPISSNSHPSATANKAKHSLKIGGGGVAKPTGTS